MEEIADMRKDLKDIKRMVSFLLAQKELMTLSEYAKHIKRSNRYVTNLIKKGMDGVTNENINGKYQKILINPLLADKWRENEFYNLKN